MKKRHIRDWCGQIHNMLLPPEFKDYRFEVNRDNMNNLRFMLILGMCLSVFYLGMEFFGITKGGYGIADSLLTTGYFALLLIAYMIYRHDWDKQATLWLYIWEAVTLFVLMFLSTVFRTENESVLMAVMMTVLPLLIVDVPLRVIGFILCMAVFYLFLSCNVKPTDVFHGEMLYISGSAFIAAVLSTRNMLSRTKIQVEQHSAVQDAEHDVLTGLYNRRGGEVMITKAIQCGTSGCFVLLDVDNFKHVNDNYGHDQGDVILKEVADTLRNCFREDRDICMRIGGDEFVVFAPNLLDHQRVRQRMGEVVNRMHRIWIDEEKGHHLTVSMGCVINTGSYPEFEAMYKRADQLLYATKKKSKDGYAFSAAEYKEQTKPENTVNRTHESLRSADLQADH